MTNVSRKLRRTCGECGHDTIRHAVCPMRRAGCLVFVPRVQTDEGPTPQSELVGKSAATHRLARKLHEEGAATVSPAEPTGGIASTEAMAVEPFAFSVLVELAGDWWHIAADGHPVARVATNLPLTARAVKALVSRWYLSHGCAPVGMPKDNDRWPALQAFDVALVVGEASRVRAQEVFERS